jgi:hypothetical protein
MPVSPNQFPFGLTATQISDAITSGEGSPWPREKTPEIVKDLARTRKGEVRPLIDDRGAVVGAKTRLYREDQIPIALIHLMLRETGSTPREVAHKVSESLMRWSIGHEFHTAYLRLSEQEADRLTPAQWLIDSWRSGERGFTFEIHFGNDRKSGAPIFVCGICKDGKRPFDAYTDRKDTYPLAVVTLQLDFHLERIFGKAD